jgi:diacylglycerol kinase family enzyme
MKISVLINGQAGNVSIDAIRTACDRALFRTEREYFSPNSQSELRDIVMRVSDSSDALVICGGDGTLNTAIQPLMTRLKSNMRPDGTSAFRIPPILPLPVGTANDLASELGLGKRLEKTARRLIESDPHAIDVIEVKSEDRTVYMLTNGGLGIAAETADLANQLRTGLRQSNPLHHVLRILGSQIYELLLAGQLLTGRTKTWLCGWCVTVELENGQKRETSAPFIMVNNQPGLGGKYIPAPLTSNTDGTFNILLVESSSLAGIARSLLKIRRGQLPDESICPRIETTKATFRSKDSARNLTFFGDGEILQRGVSEIEVTCLKRALPVFAGSEEFE